MRCQCSRYDKNTVTLDGLREGKTNSWVDSLHEIDALCAPFNCFHRSQAKSSLNFLFLFLMCLDAVVASRGRAFAGTFFSTFTGQVYSVMSETSSLPEPLFMSIFHISFPVTLTG